ncbi:MAG: RagB/SusD family nutrient uptake outer membrane protein [Chitinophagaceae bacterium]
MKQYLKLTLFTGLLLFAGFSCKKDFLDTSPTDQYAEDAVWGDPALVETFINNLYFRLYEPMTDGRGLSNIVDEAHYRGNAASLNFNKSNITIDDIPGWSYRRYTNWADLYKSIRNCNIFFSKVAEIPFPGQTVDGKTIADRMTGEVHFLRAYFYQYLATLYGGVPLIKEPFSLDDEFAVPRNTYAECISFIVEECDKAAALLPLENTGPNTGRATKGAALALKSRVLLYAASDLHNNTTIGAGFSNPALLGYTDNARAERWKAARDAAKAVIDLGKYELYKAIPGSGDSIARNITEIFLTPKTNEDILVKFFTQNMDQRWGLYTSPNGYYGWGTNAPIGELVDDFEMADGTAFDWSNPNHAAAPYANREPRFYATILYNGASWRERPQDVKGIDPLNIIQTGVWKKWNATTNAAYDQHGVDTRNSTIENWNGSYTGYYCRKYVDPSVNVQYIRQTVTWRFFRYAEILLNYAEACIALNEDAEARTYLNMIRTRAGLPGLTESGEELMKRYRNERRIELAFEEHRFFDVRRWMIGKEAYSKSHIAKVVYKLNSDKTTATVPTITHEAFETYAWLDKAYFLPIMRDEMSKNSALVQNPGY